MINPSSVPAEGGTVTISATITSSVGITDAGFTVNLASGGQLGSAMTRNAPDSDTWSGTVGIPANFSNDPISHGVDMSATGTDGGNVLEIVGSIDQDGQPVFDQAPNVSIVSIDPIDLPSDGGNVTIQASADDDHSVSEVYVTLSGPDGFLTLNLEPVGGSGWQGTISLPANTSRTAPVTYSTQATALDDAGQSAFAEGPAIHVAPVPNQEPVITNPSVAPVSLPAAGGAVTIRADVVDPDGTVAEVHADVTSPDGSSDHGDHDPAIGRRAVRSQLDRPRQHRRGSGRTRRGRGRHRRRGRHELGRGRIGHCRGRSSVRRAARRLRQRAHADLLAGPRRPGDVAASASDDRALSEVYAVVTLPAAPPARSRWTA